MSNLRKFLVVAVVLAAQFLPAGLYAQVPANSSVALDLVLSQSLVAAALRAPNVGDAQRGVATERVTRESVPVMVEKSADGICVYVPDSVNVDGVKPVRVTSAQGLVAQIINLFRAGPSVKKYDVAYPHSVCISTATAIPLRLMFFVTFDSVITQSAPAQGGVVPASPAGASSAVPSECPANIQSIVDAIKARCNSDQTCLNNNKATLQAQLRNDKRYGACDALPYFVANGIMPAVSGGAAGGSANQSVPASPAGVPGAPQQNPPAQNQQQPPQTNQQQQPQTNPQPGTAPATGGDAKPPLGPSSRAPAYSFFGSVLKMFGR